MSDDDDIEDYEDAPPRRAKTGKSRSTKKGQKSKSPRDGRLYEHLSCGGGTQITEGDFTGLCNPFQPVSKTYCASCGRYVGLDDVAWADTGETIRDFRARMKRKSPAWLTAMQYAVGPLISAGILVLLCLLVAPPNRYYLMLGALVGGPLLWWHLVMPDLGRLSSGIEYRNQK